MEKTNILAPPSTRDATSLKTRMIPVVRLPQILWKRTLKSCILVMKVSSLASICPNNHGSSQSAIMFVLLFVAVLDTVMDGLWISVLFAVFHVGIVFGFPDRVCRI
ncbi:hypothetical protein BDZ94DRAFT_1267493 [Collybia nuda]|uniref:Transmembrane protein n=1 Tax=Collybia nuda TaxID=64659 RepID=A0A9P6CBN7_9AGAR|nr:hypothetical protein BDZ94DRAFT_1267493 [Collybia nuda]